MGKKIDNLKSNMRALLSMVSVVEPLYEKYGDSAFKPDNEVTITQHQFNALACLSMAGIEACGLYEVAQVLKPVHRDDVDPDLLEAIEGALPEGMRLVCVGDIPEGKVPPEIAAALHEVNKLHQDSLVNGSCIDCGQVMPNYLTAEDLEDGELPKNWKPAQGWRWFTHGEDIVAWQCPECDQNDKNSATEGG